MANEAPGPTGKRAGLIETPEARERFLGLLKEGVPTETAAAACGMGETGVYYAMRTHQELRSEVARARAEGHVALMRRALEGDDKGTSFGPSKAALEVLQRVAPKQFAQRVNVKVDEELDELFDVAARVLPREWFEKLLVAITEHRSQGGGDGVGSRSDPIEAQSADPSDGGCAPTGSAPIH